MATDEERTRLEAWERYSVLVNRVLFVSRINPFNHSSVLKHPLTGIIVSIQVISGNVTGGWNLRD